MSVKMPATGLHVFLDFFEVSIVGCSCSSLACHVGDEDSPGSLKLFELELGTSAVIDYWGHSHRGALSLLHSISQSCAF